AAEARLQRLLVQLAKRQLLASAHDVSDGGLAVCIAESCIAGMVGCVLRLNLQGRELAKLWSEEPSRVVVSYAAAQEGALEAACREADVPFTRLGSTGGDALAIDDLCRVSLSDLARAHRGALDPIVGSEPA
ncbi:MAG TPA: AIR synthase-related protein, partial [Polyangiales bacterium]